jgi:hypothetical protein
MEILLLKLKNSVLKSICSDSLSSTLCLLTDTSSDGAVFVFFVTGVNVVGKHCLLALQALH